MILYVTTTAQSTTSGTATCPSDHPIVIGGGYTGIGIPTGTGANTQYTIESWPSTTSNTTSNPGVWTVKLNTDDPGGWTVYAVCSK
jgi:hypothetical protein